MPATFIGWSCSLLQRIVQYSCRTMQYERFIQIVQYRKRTGQKGSSNLYRQFYISTRQEGKLLCEITCSRRSGYTCSGSHRTSSPWRCICSSSHEYRRYKMASPRIAVRRRAISLKTTHGKEKVARKSGKTENPVPIEGKSIRVATKPRPPFD